jgi:pimeloyl-ACP methyl ester carboxylesterase
VLILWGQKDQVIPVDHAKKFADYLPNDTLVIWPSLGHIPMEEAPDTVANTMKQWFMKHFAINR